jgi:hypothetical protein
MALLSWLLYISEPILPCHTKTWLSILLSLPVAIWRKREGRQIYNDLQDPWRLAANKLLIYSSAFGLLLKLEIHRRQTYP